MDPNLLKHIEYFLEPNSQVRFIQRPMRQIMRHGQPLAKLFTRS